MGNYNMNIDKRMCLRIVFTGVNTVLRAKIAKSMYKKITAPLGKRDFYPVWHLQALLMHLLSAGASVMTRARLLALFFLWRSGLRAVLTSPASNLQVCCPQPNPKPNPKGSSSSSASSGASLRGVVLACRSVARCGVCASPKEKLAARPSAELAAGS